MPLRSCGRSQSGRCSTSAVRPSASTTRTWKPLILVAHSHEVDRGPSPPPPRPVAHLSRRGTALRKRTQYVHCAIEPQTGPAIDGVGQDDHRKVVLGDNARSRDVALQAARMAEPIPAIQGAANRSQPVQA
jgi:hypothetical protein